MDQKSEDQSAQRIDAATILKAARRIIDQPAIFDASTATVRVVAPLTAQQSAWLESHRDQIEAMLYEWHEAAAILEFEGGLSREDAESRAWERIAKNY